MPIYTIVAGVNGVGKSSLTGVLRSERTDLGAIIDIDKLAKENNLSPVEAGKIAITLISSFLSKRVSFAQETTLSGIRPVKTVISAKENNYAIRLFYVGLSSCDESIKRIKNRVDRGGHNIDSEDVSRRYSKRFEDLAKILPYCDETKLYDNENGFVEVGEYKNGELICKGDYKPEWLCDLKKFLNPMTR